MSAEAEAMRDVVAHARPVLAAAGFRKRRHTFNRTTEPGLVQVVTFQMGRFDPPGLTEVPGLRESHYGLFSVHVGVFVEEAWRLDVGRFGADTPPAEKRWVNDYDCQLRRVIENPAGDAMHDAWPLGDPGVPPVLIELLRDDALAWLDRFDDRAEILQALDSPPVDSYEVSGEEPDRLLATRMRVTVGDTSAAQRSFDSWVRHCRDRVAVEPHVREHLGTSLTTPRSWV